MVQEQAVTGGPEAVPSRVVQRLYRHGWSRSRCVHGGAGAGVYTVVQEGIPG